MSKTELPVELLPLPATSVKIANPPLSALLRSPLHRMVDGGLLLLRFHGRRSGREFQIPVAYHDLDGVITILTGRTWRLNMRGGADVDVVLKGRWVKARAELVEDPCEVARVYRSVLEGMGGPKRARRIGLALKEPSEMPSLEDMEHALSGHRGLVRIYPR